MSQSIEHIIEGCKRKDVESQRTLYVKYYGLVKYRIRCYISDEDLVKDLVQECFLKIFDKIHLYTSSGSIEGWISRLASNLAIDHYRKSHSLIDTSKEIERYEGSVTDDEENETIINKISKVTSYEFLQMVIDMLPLKIKIVFIMFAIEKKSHDEISNALGITIVSSRKRLQMAREWLKEYLMKHYQKEKNNLSEWT